MTIAALALLCGCVTEPTHTPHPLPRAHAHNDYLHPRPLLDALHHGFCSVEADIHLVGGQLLVAHDLEDVTLERTLENLYLIPLRERVSKNAGRVFRDGPTFTLLIDIKSEAEPTYRKLHEVLEQYADLLTVYRIGSPVMQRAGAAGHGVRCPRTAYGQGGEKTMMANVSGSRLDNLASSTEVKSGTRVPRSKAQGAVTVIISGNRPRELMAGQSLRYAALDGRLSDLPTDPPRTLVPLISDNWRNHFEWTGEGAITESERRKLRGMVEQAHAQGRRIRFWAVPDQPAAWQVLWDEDVDLINTDDLEGLGGFLKGR